ncbi:unnamed protein product [Cylicocyclus nassatus]|uniref:Uncharacterized protein n=1 Tax=Cylicocyclus nassatus TaxID=53992 RepID=A0AA36GGJ7_CYLNA|nr:unnamed protein product [Cylicocyclus nassatus]
MLMETVIFICKATGCQPAISAPVCMEYLSEDLRHINLVKDHVHESWNSNVNKVTVIFSNIPNEQFVPCTTTKFCLIFA